MDPPSANEEEENRPLVATAGDRDGEGKEEEQVVIADLDLDSSRRSQCRRIAYILALVLVVVVGLQRHLLIASDSEGPQSIGTEFNESVATLVTEHVEADNNKTMPETDEEAVLPANLTEVVLPEPTFNATCIPTALASYPGSGSTLIRLLIEMGTGVWTGSIYGDNSLYNGSPYAFKGEKTTSSVVAVKTHGPWSNHKPFPAAKRAILIIRNPQFAIPSYYNWLYGSSHDRSRQHQIQAPKAEWERWRGSNVPKEVEQWSKHFSYWLDHYNHTQNLFIGSFEHIIDPLKGPEVLSDIVTFLGFPNTHVKAIWKKVMENVSKGIHREKTYTPDLTEDQKRGVVKMLNGLSTKYESNEAASLILESYARKVSSGAESNATSNRRLGLPFSDSGLGSELDGDEWYDFWTF